MIVVVGSANMDVVARVEDLPKPGETVMATGYLQAPGGKGANQAVAAARPGGQVAFVGRLGKDEQGNRLRASLQAAGVSTDRSIVDAENPTGTALIFVDRLGENSIVVVPGANAYLEPSDVDAASDLLQAARVIVLQLEIPLPTVVRAARIGHGSGATIILNPAPARPLPPELLSQVDILIPNEEELTNVSGEPTGTEAEAAAHSLLRNGVGAVIVTRGERGALVVTGDGSFAVSSPQVNAIDTVGAGDAFVGNLAYSLDSGETLRDGVEFAVAAAAVSVQRAGAQPSMPSRAETMALLRSSS
ncbi:MAG TPA: ribokinase [Chloroflexota bacterium]|nr:ribokinase [Chloroflexota bacterium]